MKDHFPSLSYWFSCYLNQDYDLEFGSPDGALFAFKSKEVEDELRQLNNEVTELIESELDEKKLRDLLLNKLDCGYFYPAKWTTAKDWLRHIRGLLN